MRFAIRERCEWESCVSQEVRLEISTIKITIIGRDSFFHFFFRVEGLFVLRPAADLDFVSAFNLWA
jgi:hypothetical protein